MVRARRAALLAALLAVGAGDAVAGPAVEPTAPAETRHRRDGFAIGVGLGPAILKGGGDLGDVGGVGGALALRVGTAATPDLLWQLELVAGAYLVDIVDRADPSSRTTTYNANTTLTLGAQLYVLDAFWVRGGAGFAGFQQRDGGADGAVSETRRGAALIGGGGLDLFRRGMFALDGEAVIGAAIYDGAAVGQLTLALTAAWY